MAMAAVIVRIAVVGHGENERDALARLSQSCLPKRNKEAFRLAPDRS